MIRVGFVDDFAGMGGAEVALLRLASALDRSRFEAHVWAPGGGNFAHRVREAGLVFHPLPLDQRKADLFRVLPALGTGRQFRREVREAGISLLHANSFFAAYFTAAAGLPFLIAVHAFPLVHDWRKRVFFKTTVGVLVRRARQVLCVSDALRAELGRLLPSKTSLETVYNGVDPAWFTVARGEARRQFGFAPEAFVAGMAGRLHPRKGQGVFLEALALLKDRHPHLRGVIAGSECVTPLENLHYADALRRRIVEAGLQGRVDLLEDLPGVYGLMPAFDAVVLPSEEETFGLVLLEAAVCEIPVVASRVGGIPEQVRDGETGYLIPPKNPPALAEALERLLTSADRGMSLGTAGRAQALLHFSFQAQVRKMEGIYEQVIQR